jgi:hypothetical protein
MLDYATLYFLNYVSIVIAWRFLRHDGVGGLDEASRSMRKIGTIKNDENVRVNVSLIWIHYRALLEKALSVYLAAAMSKKFWKSEEAPSWYMSLSK